MKTADALEFATVEIDVLINDILSGKYLKIKGSLYLKNIDTLPAGLKVNQKLVISKSQMTMPTTISCDDILFVDSKIKIPDDYYFGHETSFVNSDVEFPEEIITNRYIAKILLKGGNITALPKRINRTEEITKFISNHEHEFSQKYPSNRILLWEETALKLICNENWQGFNNYNYSIHIQISDYQSLPIETWARKTYRNSNSRNILKCIRHGFSSDSELIWFQMAAK